MSSPSLPKDTNKNFVYQAAFSALRPQKRLTVTEWANENRFLSQISSAEPGRYRSDRTPYMEEIMDCLSAHHPAQDVVFKKASQLGATEAGLNWIGYVVDHSPAPMMLVVPTLDLARSVSKQRIDPLIEANESISSKIKPARSRDSGNTTFQKEFPGGILTLTGANSPVTLSSTPARFVMLDELSRFPKEAGKEGSPIKLVLARTRTFSRRKRYFVSTPTVEGECEISDLFELSDKRHFYVPCPDCGHQQKLEFKQLKWEKDKPQTTSYQCVECDSLWKNYQKTHILKAGKWIAEAESEIVGFFLNSLYSPVGWYGWEELVSDWLSAQGDPLDLKTFVNTVLGESWREQGEAPDYERLYERAEDYPIGRVPDGCLVLFAGVDVQKDRIEVEVVGFGRSLQSWSVEYFIIDGDPETSKPWNDLDKLLEQEFKFVDEPEAGLRIKFACIDSGYATQAVYNYCRTRSGKIVPIKGRNNQAAMISSGRAVEIKYDGKRWRKGVTLFTLGVDELKSELYRWLELKTGEDGEYPPKYCHFPKYSKEYFQGLCSEELQIKRRGGQPVYIWSKIFDRNEPLDCRVYARAATLIAGVHRYTEKEWDALAQSVKNLKEKKKQNRQEDDKIKGGIPTKRSSFWD